MTLEAYLKENIDKQIIDFTLRAASGPEGTTFYIHPACVSGKTVDFTVDGNALTTKFVTGE